MKIIDTDAAEDRESMRKAAQKVSIRKQNPAPPKKKLTNAQQAALYYQRKRRRLAPH